MTAEHPEDGPAEFSRDDVRRALEQADDAANEFSGDYAAAMRHARLIIEEQLLG